MIGLNIGSGQRRFESTGSMTWVNVDCVSRPPDQVPDFVCDVGREKLPYFGQANSNPKNGDYVDVIVLHQVYEHFGLGEGHGLIRECHRVLKPGGSLIITIPDMKALAHRWLLGQISEYIYFVNVYGAYQGEEGDRHKFGYTYEGLLADFQNVGVSWSDFGKFSWRSIEGANIARDWWILGVEARK